MMQRSVQMVCAIHDDLPGYGYRRVTEELSRRGQVANHKRGARLMKAHGLGPTPRRRFVRTTDSDNDQPIFPNLNRNVIPTLPNTVWVGDIIYIRLPSGPCYLAVILDACRRKVVRYALSRRMDTELTLVALTAAVRSPQPAAGCIHHTGRDSHYASDPYRQAPADFGLRVSMSAPAKPYENAQA